MTIEEFESKIKVGDVICVPRIRVLATYLGCKDDVLYFASGQGKLKFQIYIFDIRWYICWNNDDSLGRNKVNIDYID